VRTLGLGTVTLLAVGLLCPCRVARAEHEEWPQLLQAFKDTWKIDGLEESGIRSKLRAEKRAAVKGLRASHDARAVPVLLGAHKKQQKFIEDLERVWAGRQDAWDKVRPEMDRIIDEAAKAQGVPPGGNVLLPAPVVAWVKEKDALESLRRDIASEEEIADYTRKAMARVCNTVDGKERSTALAPLLKAAGRGQKQEQREFIRLLGYVEGDEATEALEKLAADMQPFVAATALEALGRQQAPRSIDTLLTRLEDPRWQLRVAALEGLSFFKDARVVDALLGRLDAEDGVLRRHYFTALGRILNETLPATTEAWSSWWKANREDVVKRWAEKRESGPVVDELPTVMVKSESNSGSTSFYGLKTESKHIIFVIDISGSMGEVGGKNDQGQMRIDVVKRELTNAIKSLQAEDGDERGAASFNIVAYAADVQVFKEGKMIDATKSNKEKAFAWIEKLEAVGATNIYDAIEQAFGIINTRREMKQFEKGADTIFLMTDGKPNRGKVTDPVLIREEVRKLNRERKLTIHTIGVGEGHDAGFLKALAAENNGEYLAR